MTREQIATWLDVYFEAANDNQGAMESVARAQQVLRRTTSQFWMYTPPPFMTPPLSREELLMTFVHPGHPRAAHPQLLRHRRGDPAGGRAVRAAVHPHGVGKDLARAAGERPLPPERRAATAGSVIGKILYWTQSHPDPVGDDFGSLFTLWGNAKEQALVEFGMKRFLAGSGG